MATEGITKRPRKDTRRNARGEWRCCDCRTYFPAEDFYWDGRRQRPQSYCKPCNNLRTLQRRQRKALDDAWWSEYIGRQMAYYRKRRDRNYAERGEMARVFLVGLRNRGVSGCMVTAIAGVPTKTQRRLLAGGGLRFDRVLDRLFALHRVCWELPLMQRGAGSRAHPHLAEITYRYQAAQKAHA